MLLAASGTVAALAPARAGNNEHTLAQRLPRCAPALAARQSTVVLSKGRHFVGTGFVYGDQRTIATAQHVADAGVDRAEDRAGHRYRVVTVAVDQKRDLAIMRLDRAIAVAPLQPATRVSVGITVFAIGHPRVMLGRPYERLTRWTVTGGHVSGVDDDWVASDATVYPGNSGSALVDCEGRVLAVASHGPDDLRIVFYGRATHLEPLRNGNNGPRYRVPIEPVTAIDVAGLAGPGQLGASVGVTWRSERGWFLRFTGSASSNGLSGDIFGAGLHRRARAGIFGGIALRPFAGWRAASFHVEPVLGVALERDMLRTAVLDGAGGVTSESTRKLSGLGVAALRIQLGHWFIEPQVSVSIGPNPRVEWFVTVGYSVSL